MKIKRMIKQLFCAHKWECHAVSYSEGTVSRYYQCPKCGKRTKMVYAMFLALYRCMDYGFSADMLVKLVKLVTEVRYECKDDKKKLWKACQEETGINLMEYERKGVIE